MISLLVVPVDFSDDDVKYSWSAVASRNIGQKSALVELNKVAFFTS